MALKLQYGIISDIGKKRKINEDSVMILPDEQVFIVADGMGGHYGGEIASNLAVEILKTKFKENNKELLEDDPIYTKKIIDFLFEYTNDKIREKALESDFHNDMGTTIAGMKLFKSSAMIFHIGDSRVYLFRENELFQITTDHSWVNDQVRFNKMSATDSKNHKWKNVIMRAMGSKEKVHAEYSHIEVSSNDTFLICSDGLSDMVNERIINKVLARENDPQLICNILLDEALKKGGFDNISIISVRVL